MKRSLSFLMLLAWTSAVGCAGTTPKEKEPPAKTQAVEAPPAESPPPAETLPAGPTPVEPTPAEPAPETTAPAAPEPAEAVNKENVPAPEMPKDLDGVKKLLEATKDGPRPVTLAEALQKFPAFAESLVSALAADDEKAIESHILSGAELELVFVPAYLSTVSQGDRDWLQPIRDRFKGAQVRKVAVVRGKHASESMGASSLHRSHTPSAFGRIIIADTEGGPIDLLIKQSHFVNGAWKVFRMELVGPDEREP